MHSCVGPAGPAYRARVRPGPAFGPKYRAQAQPGPNRAGPAQRRPGPTPRPNYRLFPFAQRGPVPYLMLLIEGPPVSVWTVETLRPYQQSVLIREMGRNVVEDEESAGKTSRLWNNPKVIKTFRKQRVPTITSIEGIMFEGGGGTSGFSAPCLQEMDRLRLFYIHNAKLKGFPHFPEDLKWLSLPHCQCFEMPTSVSIPGEVTVLHIYGNDDVANVLLEKCTSRNMVFNKLKVLDLSLTSITITPDFSCIPCLAKLTLDNCKELVEVHESVGQLKSLIWLSLTVCMKLLKLPNTICQLTSLEFLSLCGCWNLLDLPKQLGNIASLKHLDFRTGSSHIRTLPDSMRRLHDLEHLLIDHNMLGISSDSDDLVAASKLISHSAYVLDVLPDPCCRRKTKLELIDDTFEELTETFIRWENLESLILNCESLKSLPAGIGQLQKLKVLEMFENLKILSLDGDPMNVTPSFSCLPCLEKLMLMNCKELIEVHESIESLKKLQFLKITGCTMLERLPDNICELRSLKSLNLMGCVKLSSLPERLVDHMELLEELFLDQTGIRSLPAASMGKLPTSLRSLSIKNCQSLKGNIPVSLISPLETLVDLHIIGGPFKGMSNNDYFELKSTISLRASTSWEFMDALPISCCESILRFCFTNKRIEKLTDSIGRFGHVECMTLRCKMLKVLPNSIGKLKNLKDLTLKCHTLALFDCIYLSESLERLVVECIEFEPLPSPSKTIGTSTASSSKNVKESKKSLLSLDNWEASLKIRATRVMKKLKKFYLCAKQITATPDFSFAPYLEDLILRNCEMLTEVHKSVETLGNLKSLSIKGCNALEGLPHIICHLTSLEWLELSQHFDLSSSPENLGLRETRIKSILTSTEKLTQLQYLNLQNSCPGWGNFKGIVFQVRSLEISGSCWELVTALSSSRLHSVEILVITDDQIEALPDSIAQMQKLKHLKLKCQSLKAQPKWIGQLKQLRTFVLDCNNIPPFIDEMCSWEHIEIRLSVRCFHLETVTPTIEGLQNVKCIANFIRQMMGCWGLETLPDLDVSLGGLRELSLSRCKNMISCLDLSEAGIVELPPWLGCFENMTHLKLNNITQNDVLLSGLSHMTSLEELDLSGSNLESLPSCISSFSRLMVLKISGCKQLHTIPHLSAVLRVLDASNCSKLTGLPNFSNLHSLRKLSLRGCNSLEYIPGFETIATKIEYLELPGPSGGIECSNLSNDFKNRVFMLLLILVE
ncbi:Disease resistance protein [Nymphaea thermarum]|nr:Disease resistance protein [Nymphaea thermarum]